MVAPRRKPAPLEPDLSSLPDFQLLHELLAHVSEERFSKLKALAWEMMRRYTAWVAEQPPASSRDYNAILGEARWGDAKRVEAIFGVKRGVVNGLVDKGLIKSKVLGEDPDTSTTSVKKKAKRIYGDFHKP
ncbi:MAG: hypothetical protein H7A49_08140 [Akkermansiaceae bacterium]|nr:hypothetical protein [Akkermansiaceae bacterium]